MTEHDSASASGGNPPGAAGGVPLLGTASRAAAAGDPGGGPVPEAAPILDWQTAVGRMDNREDLLDAVAATFHVECVTLLDEVRAALATSDAKRLRRAAHTLKGAAGAFCAQPAAAAARTVEQLAGAGDLSAAAAAWPAAEHAFAQLLAALAARREKQRPAS